MQLMRKSIIAGALLLYTACGDGGGGQGPGPVATVTVTASASQISVNGTTQATAVAKDANGTTVTGKTATWTSLSPTVASVNSSTGVVTGVAAGTATIQATIDGINGSTSIQVTAPVGACSAGLTTVDLAVGAFRELSANATNGCIKIPAATSAPADYLVIPANTDSARDNVGNYVLKSDEGETVPANNLIPSNAIFDASSTPAIRAAAEPGAAQTQFENRLRLEERRDLSIPNAQRAWRGRQVNSQLRYALSAAIPAVGDMTEFKVPSQTNPCNSFTRITAQVQFINDKVIIYNDVASPSGGFTATDYQQIGDEFATLIYPTDVAYFGTPLDQDGNSRVVILYTPQVNKLTPSGQSGFVGGFFWAGDLFPVSGAGSCAQSNLAEMFYVLTPDPTGSINSNVRTTSSVRQGTRGTIAHEFQHMINASERIRSPIVQNFEQVWLDEGLSHFAEDAVGRAIRGIGEADDANFTTTLAGNANDFNAFFFQNFARLRSYMLNPGPIGPNSSLADTSLAARGAVWGLLHYAADHYAPNGDVKAFTQKLAGGPDSGVVNLTCIQRVVHQQCTQNTSWDVMVSGWMAANYADNLGIPNLAPLYTYSVYDMRSIMTAVDGAVRGAPGVYPLKINTITGANFALTGLQARSGSGNYFFITRNAGSPARTFRFLNADGTTSASFTAANWILLRTR
jgi:hypothetical protein